LNTIGFEHITGQEIAVSHLRSLLNKDSCAGAYLFTGQEGIGKKISAISFAKALVCHKASPDPCNECVSCKKISSALFFHPDITLYHDVYNPVGIPRFISLKKMGYEGDESLKGEDVYLEACKLLKKKELLLNPVSSEKGVETVDFFYLNPAKLFVEKDGKTYISSSLIESSLEPLIRENSSAHVLAKWLYTFTKGFYKQSFKVGAQEGEDGRENVRGIIKDIYLKPSEGKRKVFIIDDAHKITEVAADAFLKTLEEPPKDSVIILITSKPEMLLQTIRSRCKKIKFQPIGKKSICEFIRKTKNLGYEDSLLVASFSQGSLGRALEMNLDEVLEKRQEIINLTSQDSLKNTSRFFHFARVFSGEGKEDRRHKINSTQEFIELMLSWVRDLILVKRDGDREMVINFDKIDELKKISNKYSFEKLETIFSIFSGASRLLSRNVDVRIMIESCLVEMKEVVSC